MPGASEEKSDANVSRPFREAKLKTRAKYFCTGMLDIAKYSHWALNVPLYTHFTVSHSLISS